MRVVILSQYYPPERGAPQNRLSHLAKRLVRRGHAVSVLTALPNYPGDTVFPEYADRENCVEEMDGVRVARVGLYVPPEKTFAKRLRCYVSFARNARKHGPRLVGPSADVLLMESPPLFTALAGPYLARRLGAALVSNISDLWPRSAVDLGMLRSRPALWASTRLEEWMYRKSSLIFGQSDGIVRDISARFPSKRVELLPNGVDLSEYDGELERHAVRERFGWPEELFVVGYAGILGHAQALHRVLEAAELVAADRRVFFALFGDGPCRGALEEQLRARAITTAGVFPAEPRERVPHLQSAFDAGLVPLAEGKVFEGVRPSKMFETMAAGRPLVLCARGEPVRVLEGAGATPAGVVVPPEDPRRLADAVLALAADRAAARAKGAAGRELVRRSFDRNVLSDAAAALLEGMFGGSGNGSSGARA